MLKQYKMASISIAAISAVVVSTAFVGTKTGLLSVDVPMNAFAEDNSPTVLKTEVLEKDIEAVFTAQKNNYPVASRAESMGRMLTSAGNWQEETQAISAVSTLEENQSTEEQTEETLEMSNEVQTEEIVEQKEASRFEGYVLPNVDVYLNIRDTASPNGAVVGKLYVGALAEVVEEGEEWSKISSGSVEGYVNNEYIVTGEAAEEMAKQVGKMTATVKEGGLRVRKDPSTEADVYNIVGEGQTFEVVEELDGWVGVEYSSDVEAYLSSDYVDVSFDLGQAISIEEEMAQIKAAEEAAAKAAEEERMRIEAERAEQAAKMAQSSDVQTEIRAGMDMTYDDTYLLACLVHMEAVGESYQGKLAVANVVLNRLKSGYGNTLAEVIYAKNQFSGANTGALASRLAKGPSAECMQAAVEALSGVNNIEDYRNFIALSKANMSSYSEYTIIGNHCFYKR